MADDDKALIELREHYVASVFRSGKTVLMPELLQRLDALARTVLSDDDSASRKAAAQAIEVVLQTLKTGKWQGRRLQFSENVRKVLQDIIALELLTEPSSSLAALHITVKALIIPGDQTNDGILVKGVTALWFEIFRMIQADPDSIHQIGCWKWEELLAGAYKQDGWETVVLTPKRGDHGIDVIAERKGWGQLRFLLLDQMKAYKPGHLIGPDEIREMKGVLLDHPEASKGLITTTADFTPGALEAAANLAPRLELRPRDKLVEWLASVAVEELGSSNTSEKGSGNA